MINENDKIVRAVGAHTRAGCDFGAFSTANIQLERVPQDVDTVLGVGSTESQEAHSNSTKASADFLGIAIRLRPRAVRSATTAMRSPICCRTSPAPTPASRPSSAIIMCSR